MKNGTLVFRTLFRKECGFTLLELLVSMAITGFLGAGIVSAIVQIEKVADIDQARVIAVKQVENAIHYINRDVQSAQIVTTQGSTGFTVGWTSWGAPLATPAVPAANVQVIYSLDNAGKLKRNGAVVAEWISSITVTPPNPGAVPPTQWYTVKISAVVQSGSKQASETRQIDIVPRPAY
jgi:prepilin-type N-terminal cleavage/methylation domain-containing protein